MLRPHPSAPPRRPRARRTLPSTRTAFRMRRARDDEVVCGANRQDPLARQPADRVDAPSCDRVREVGDPTFGRKSSRERNRPILALVDGQTAEAGAPRRDGERRARTGIDGRARARGAVRERVSHPLGEVAVGRSGEAPECAHRCVTRSRRPPPRAGSSRRSGRRASLPPTWRRRMRGWRPRRRRRRSATGA